MKHLKYKLTHNWHLMRLLRLGLGIVAGIQSIQMLDFLSGIVALVLLYQAISDTGCCGSAGCAPVNRSQAPESNRVSYQEIK